MRVVLLVIGLSLFGLVNANSLLGLPEVPVPENNPQSEAKIALGERLFEDKRFSSTGDVSL